MAGTSLRHYLWRLFCVLAATMAIVLFWKDTVQVTGLLLAFAILINYKVEKAEVISYIVVAILATLLEALANSSGAWTYAQPHVLNFPLWLPLYWGMGGVVMKDVYIVIKRLSEK